MAPGRLFGPIEDAKLCLTFSCRHSFLPRSPQQSNWFTNCDPLLNISKISVSDLSICTRPPSKPPVRIELTTPCHPQPSSTHTRRTQVLESGSEYARRRVCEFCSSSPAWAYFPRLPDILSEQLGRTHDVFLQPSPDISQFIPVEKYFTVFHPELGLYRSKSMPLLCQNSLKPQRSMFALFESVQCQT